MRPSGIGCWVAFSEAAARIAALEAENRLLRTPDQTMRHELESLRGENQSLREQVDALRSTHGPSPGNSLR
jgi:hypothetical protein